MVSCPFGVGVSLFRFYINGSMHRVYFGYRFYGSICHRYKVMTGSHRGFGSSNTSEHRSLTGHCRNSTTGPHTVLSVLMSLFGQSDAVSSITSALLCLSFGDWTFADSDTRYQNFV